MIGFGYFMTLVYVFFVHSRLVELLAPDLRLPQLLAAGALLIALLSGTIVRPLKHPVGIGFLFLTAWFFVGVPFSSYRTGALTYLLTTWLKNLMLFVMVVALVNSRRHCARMLAMLGLGSTGVAVASLAIHSYGSEGRLILANTSLNDPNALGMAMLLGLPLLMSVIADRSRYLTTRLAAALCVVPILAALPLTGSRGTLVAALIVTAYLAKRFSIGGKLGLAVVVSLVVLVTVSYLSERLLDRFSTVVNSEEVEATVATESRTYLFKQGLILIARHPIFGVGPQMFPVAENELAIEQGLRRGTWHTCHNMYIQVASEGGLPAIAIFLWILRTTWKTLTRLERLRRDEHPRASEVVRLAFWMKITLLAFCACGLFLSIGLTPNFLLVIAMPLTLGRVVRFLLNQIEAEKKAEEDVEEPKHATRLYPAAAPLRGLRDAS